jgi:hypothetical protein
MIEVFHGFPPSLQQKSALKQTIATLFFLISNLILIWACSTHGAGRMSIEFWFESQKERDH